MQNEFVKKRNENICKKTVKALEGRNFESYYCETISEARELALKLIPKGSSISWGGSSTINEIGLTDALHAGDYIIYDTAEAKNEEETEKIYRQAFSCDYFLTSANAIASDGVIVNIDGRGNRAAAICYGPRNVLVIAGVNKIMPDLHSALARARNTAAPANQLRFEGNLTPCVKTGECGNCKADDCICCQILATRMSRPKNRIKVILVSENLGF